jgi:hypothetical protein
MRTIERNSIRQLKSQAMAAYAQFSKHAEMAIQKSALRIVQMPLFVSYCQGMGSWDFRLSLNSFTGSPIISDNDPIAENDLPTLRQIVTNRDRYKNESFEWREENPPPSQENVRHLERAIDAIAEHYELIQGFEDCLSGSFLGTPLMLDHTGSKKTEW